jgi:uncharacterized protein YdeI (BOF family)
MKNIAFAFFLSVSSFVFAGEYAPPAPDSVPQAPIPDIHTLEQVLVEKEIQEEATVQGRIISEQDGIYMLDDGTATLRVKPAQDAKGSTHLKQGGAVRVHGYVEQIGPYKEKIMIITEVQSLTPQQKTGSSTTTASGPWNFSDSPIREVLTDAKLGSTATVQGKIIFKKSPSEYIIQDKTGSIEITLDTRNKSLPELASGDYVRITAEVSETDSPAKQKYLKVISLTPRSGLAQPPSMPPSAI